MQPNVALLQLDLDLLPAVWAADDATNPQLAMGGDPDCAGLRIQCQREPPPARLDASADLGQRDTGLGEPSDITVQNIGLAIDPLNDQCLVYSQSGRLRGGRRCDPKRTQCDEW